MQRSRVTFKIFYKLKSSCTLKKLKEERKERNRMAIFVSLRIENSIFKLCNKRKLYIFWIHVIGDERGIGRDWREREQKWCKFRCASAWALDGR